MLTNSAIAAPKFGPTWIQRNESENAGINIRPNITLRNQFTPRLDYDSYVNRCAVRDAPALY